MNTALPTVAITGSTGLIGSALVDHLRAAGHRVVRLVRRAALADEVRWDPAAGELDPAHLEGVDAIVHLAGAGIADHRWTDAHKDAIRASRIDSTALLARVITEMERRPAVLLSGSAIGIYGNRHDEVLDESSAPGTGFLADVTRAWEAAAAPAAEAGVRVAYLRTGIVLTPRGGALKKQLPLYKLCLGGKFGRGDQWQSWISLRDEVGAIEHLLGATVHGPVNLTAPHPVTSAEFATTLGRVLGRPTMPMIPSFGPKPLLGSELAEHLLFEGQRVLPRALEASGYSFRDPELDTALRTMLDKAPAPVPAPVA